MKTWLAGSIFLVLGLLQTAQAALVKKDVEYNLAGRPYVGYLVYDDASKDARPGLLVVHNWMGVTDETKSKADQLAALGYVAFAADVYGKGIRPKNPDEAGKLAGTFKKDRTMLRAHLQEGLATLLKQPQVDKKKVAALGYCFGGTSVIEVMRAR